MTYEISKKDCLTHLKKLLKERIEHSLQEALSLKEAATHEESKAENKYDTRGLEASYMAQAQSKRAMEQKKELYYLEKLSLPTDTDCVKLGSLVVLNNLDAPEGSSPLIYFLVPSAGGYNITLDSLKGQSIKSLTLSSPLGSKLFNKEIGDCLKIKKAEFEILQIV